MTLGLCACGGKAPAAEPETSPLPLADGTSYADIHMQFLSVRSALLDTVEQRIERSNAALRERDADSYYMDSSYLVMTYVPFSTVWPGLAGSLTDDTARAEEELRGAFPDAVLTNPAPGVYEAVFTYVDKTSGQAVDRAGRCVWERDGERGSFRVRAWIDDVLAEFTEFIPQGDDLYLLYTMTDLALVRYADGQVTRLQHVHRISEPPLGAFPGDMRPFSLDSFDPFPAGSADGTLLAMGDDVQYRFVLENGVMTYEGKISQDLSDGAGNRTGVRWIDIEPITLLG